MTRQVPLDRPLSDEDREYLHARGQHARVEQMDADFPASEDDSTEERPNWEGMTLAALEAEVARVNTEYDAGLEASGKKAELVARLAEWWDKPSE